MNYKVVTRIILFFFLVLMSVQNLHAKNLSDILQQVDSLEKGITYLLNDMRKQQEEFDKYKQKTNLKIKSLERLINDTTSSVNEINSATYTQYIVTKDFISIYSSNKSNNTEVGLLVKGNIFLGKELANGWILNDKKQYVKKAEVQLMMDSK